MCENVTEASIRAPVSPWPTGQGEAPPSRKKANVQGGRRRFGMGVCGVVSLCACPDVLPKVCDSIRFATSFVYVTSRCSPCGTLQSCCRPNHAAHPTIYSL